ncbi:hypothetical protein QTP81_16940 [Alteromonas sp. ASW11-36]|uniref:DUF4175 domain-containing protein n=1 Tax=Alteromonas arenosi TaxID=3055817 RepID=A0ABT7T1H1_9ALTE|nr:hypothetical protein [Alteromonas sp. ASW11-36]MDM7862296.1 hypothetical protein [Alteromonas sp. ASW11-36]
MNKNLMRFLKFVFIAAPFVAVYFFSLIVFFLALTDAEDVGFGRIAISVLVAMSSVLIVTWACGFWGRWWFPVLFASLPIIVLIDFLISATVGAPPLVMTVLSFFVLSTIGLFKRAGTIQTDQAQPHNSK